MCWSPGGTFGKKITLKTRGPKCLIFQIVYLALAGESWTTDERELG